MRSHSSWRDLANVYFGVKDRNRQQEQERNFIDTLNQARNGGKVDNLPYMSPDQAVTLQDFILKQGEAEKAAQQQRGINSTMREVANGYTQPGTGPVRPEFMQDGQYAPVQTRAFTPTETFDKFARLGDAGVAAHKGFAEAQEGAVTSKTLADFRATEGNEFASGLPSAPSPVTGTHVNGQGQRVAFSAVPGQPAQTTTLGMEQAKTPSAVVNNFPNVDGKGLVKLNENMTTRLLDERDKASSAVTGLETIAQGRQLIQEGIITGAGANTLVSVGKGLQRAGINIAEDPIANTEAYASLMGRQVGEIIKMFGSGTGLSDADRAYAQKIAGGEITVNEQALKRILDIGETAYSNVLTRYNARAEEVMNRQGADQLLYDLRIKMPGSESGGTGDNTDPLGIR